MCNIDGMVTSFYHSTNSRSFMQYVYKWHHSHSQLQGIEIHVLENDLYATHEDESSDTREEIKLEPCPAYDSTSKWIKLPNF